MKATVVKRVSFDAAHFLPNYPGKCANLHGHHWVVEVGISGKVGENGMVIDFGEIKSGLKPILDNFDHRLINNVVPNPTAENIASYIFNWVSSNWPVVVEGGVTIEFIKVWETEDSYALLSY